MVEPVAVEPTEVQVAEGVSEEELAIQQLIQAAKGMAPIDFVSSIKAQKKGYVSKAERQLIFDLVSVSGLPNEVLNILFHYALVQLDNATLARNFIDCHCQRLGYKKKSRTAQRGDGSCT